MSAGDRSYHPSHEAAEPQTVGWRTGMVYCRACGALLQSERGPGTSPRVVAVCQPVQEGFRGAARMIAPALA